MKVERDIMGKKTKRLIESIASKDNILLAAQKARKGNPSSVGGMVFMDYLEANIELISKSILDGSYYPGKHKEFIIFEPKRRVISALPFKDRVVQHAINNIIEPIFESTFYTQSYGCRTGKGTHSGAIKCQAMQRRLLNSGDVWILKTDFSGYFYNIDRAVLHKRIRSKISCKKTLDLIAKFIPTDGVGIPIGNLTSQLFANVYGTIADEWLLHNAKQKDFIRYMDDIAIFGKSKAEMLGLQEEMQEFCKSVMKLDLSHWSVTNVNQGVNFLGYRIWPTHKLLRRQSVATAKRKIKRYKKSGDAEKLNRFLASWLGHAKWADSKNLIKSLEIEQCAEKLKS
ncbi:reverse transcriptase domain-containing protein [Aliivibrio sp. S4TY2]|uniref:reverse transcriptase domain-containing protein n=1 Tax=unclassified Aliivibrio TaxID=2645654 RepID=UPI0023783A95|nr:MULTISPECIES: reverse transcriptase domain-containing protein [unclassified Aliivibrio]MDD9154955.1 reverse transcriptase domain-containing protein [Aliivibrio sp. S4TY2]MDD9158682.1 reverse transcriptase domain-containing protein [Aliivibrio sp. S4TY1]MDD9162958.1 reverse transcriptase domain-containing protein [Aliivibrio sp. S4MY2]MDD9166681.1 reverse transcriptase domain-containing protein [Aliivibrio sp. S4MY4]MDD9184035.1 reverse transcriptase domain-containing protein [Aliivibrio sp.